MTPVRLGCLVAAGVMVLLAMLISRVYAIRTGEVWLSRTVSKVSIYILMGVVMTLSLMQFLQ